MRLHVCFVLAICLSTVQSALVSGSPAETVKQVQQIIAHRGASSDRPENTLPAFRQAIKLKATAVEIDVRTSKDGELFLLHDAKLERTTNGKGPASELTMPQLKQLDAGAWFKEEYRGERIPTLAEALEVCRGKIDVLLDLKEQGSAYAEAVAKTVREHGDPQHTIVGVRSVEQAHLFRKLLPQSPQLGFIPSPETIDAFAKAGVETIRLWPRWLVDESLVPKVHHLGVKLHLNGSTGKPEEIIPLLQHKPDWLLVDDVATLMTTLKEHQQNGKISAKMDQLIDKTGGPALVPGTSRPNAVSFLNRDYKMLELPKELEGQPRYLFDGGSGNRVEITFKKPAVVFAAFEYNNTGAWSFPQGRSPEDHGWQRLSTDAYRGSSNDRLKDKPHFASIYFCEFKAGQTLSGLPPWWLCLAITDLKSAKQIPGFKAGTSGPVKTQPTFSYEAEATRPRPLQVPEFKNRQQWSEWQAEQRRAFQQQLVFPYRGKIEITPVGAAVERETFRQREFAVTSDGQRIFRFFRLTPRSAPHNKVLPTIACFMGHGKVNQILEDRNSYQHACAARFAEQGYLVYAMENVGMEPGSDRHHELDHLLRLDGYSWYGLLFAHQQILLQHVFADQSVNTKKVGVTGVSTGGLLALSAAAFEPRVAATSVQGIFGSMRVSFIRDRHRHCHCGAIPGLLPQFDLPEMALLVTPRPLHISNAVSDGFSPAEAKRCIKLIAPLYEQAGGETPEFSEPPGRHEYAFEEALQFFTKTIGKPE
ncbi:glycerophosphodiester phosphodiesterase family protein [Gimesia panareensis]|uniref:glycerophosphodiester phosphodiesterase family protein n=1 Tax=Gimesia panareensis TaxID=2527978 RepID=UPI00118BAE45|nr:glycerophosphodiester phosphodiesterase family protein [Gimesia panareensis]QDU49586.1 Glycerophosphoryl diester phosphodiesterase [Gimesia panareensis]